jgi:energy-coupling factor transport system ATP-binding protein
MTVQFDNVSFRYAPGIEVFDRLRIGIDAGSQVLIVGRNGAGKSTFLKLLNGILHPNAGTITVNGLDTHQHPTSRLAAEVSVTFQNPSHQLFAATVLREAEFAPRNLSRENPRERAMEALRLFHLDRNAKSHPYDLSPAKRKLLTLASAIASGADALAFDEPSVDLSHPEQRILLEAFSSLKKGGKTILIVSHDLELFLPVCSHVLILNGGKATFHDKPESLLSNQDILRRSGVRLPMVYRFRPYFGLRTIPDRE